MTLLRGTKGTLLLAALAMSGTTCTLLLDHNAVQCKTDADCNTLGTYPHCDSGLCKPSGLMPQMCFPIQTGQVPMTQADFLNACTLNAMVDIPSDNEDNICLHPTTKPEDGSTLKPAVVTVLAAKKPATPTVMCTNLAMGKPILYISGSSNFAPLLQELSVSVVNDTGIMPVFRTTTSCTGVKSMNPMSPTYGADHNIKDPNFNDPMEPYPTYAQAYLGDGNPSVPCLLGTTGAEVNIGESEIAPDTCSTSNPSDSVGEFLGPILPIVFVVPKASTQKAISAEAAKQVFGGGGSIASGGGGSVDPWVDPKFLFIRGQGTATLRLVANEIGLPFNQFWGTDQGSAATLANNLGNIGNYAEANKALGIIGTDYYDQMGNRNSLKALGFQAAGQSCAYLPDSSLTSLDKMNVRDGHYPLWGRIHFFAARQNNMLTSPTADAFLKLFSQQVLSPDILKALINAGFVPPCAMKVTRTSELGDFTYAVPPATACGCAFDAQVGVTPLDPACTTCTGDLDCANTGRPKCRYGYCENESS